MDAQFCVALYLRVAAEEQTDLALDHQEMVLKTYAKGHGYCVIESIREKCNGLSCDRPALNRLLEISSEKAGYVLVKNYNRIGRNSFDVIHWINRLEASGKKLLSMEDNEAPSNIDVIYQAILKYHGI